jgi:hypothetical protein
VADMVNVFYFISLLTPFLTDFIHILGERFPFPSPLKMLKGENKQSFMLWNFSFLFIFVAKCGWNPLQVLILCKHKNDSHDKGGNPKRGLAEANEGICEG